jgi:hypothetical protein
MPTRCFSQHMLMLPDVVTILVSYSVDHFNAFVLPSPEEQKLTNHQTSTPLRNLRNNRSSRLPSIRRPPRTFLLSPLRLPDRRRLRRILQHPTSSRLPVLKSLQHCCHRTGYCTEHLVRCSWGDCWGLDLQSGWGEKGASDGRLDECGVVVLCSGGVCGFEAVLWVEECWDGEELDGGRAGWRGEEVV